MPALKNQLPTIGSLFFFQLIEKNIDSLIDFMRPRYCSLKSLNSLCVASLPVLPITVPKDIQELCQQDDEVHDLVGNLITLGWLLA